MAEPEEGSPLPKGSLSLWMLVAVVLQVLGEIDRGHATTAQLTLDASIEDDHALDVSGGRV